MMNDKFSSAMESIAKSMEKLSKKESTDKNVAKPPVYKNDEAAFATWNKKLLNYVGSTVSRSRALMEWAAKQSVPITRETLEAHVTDEDLRSDLTTIQEGIYSNLNSYTDGESFNIVSNTPGGQGLEAYKNFASGSIR